ncbi:unnamed protein product [Lasius platythorax]|uniref:Uncharacterized protein n=1 Tax=Lasius platythorax TaxID=488582 RepID=A0AAV2N4S1_9HYME
MRNPCLGALNSFPRAAFPTTGYTRPNIRRGARSLSLSRRRTLSVAEDYRREQSTNAEKTEEKCKILRIKSSFSAVETNRYYRWAARIYKRTYALFLSEPTNR